LAVSVSVSFLGLGMTSLRRIKKAKVKSKNQKVEKLKTKIEKTKG